MQQPKRVAVGMSGGVDSSVAAALLKEKGYEVTGVFIEAYNEPGCRTDEDRKDALKVATQLGIRFQTLDVRKEYREKVVNYFFEEYRAGRTPNPDVVCNREVKFGLFYDWAIGEGSDLVATGHYARIHTVTQDHGDTVTRFLQRARDESKDQSYFLWQVEPEKLEKILFPLGEMTKKEVRARAAELGLPNAAKPDSMGVCMMGELNVREFLRAKLGERPGEVMLQGHSATAPLYQVGKHRGLWFHTIGERVGQDVRFKIKDLREVGVDTTNMPVLYVVGKDREKNQLIVGTRNLAETQNFRITDQVSRITHEQMEGLVREGKLFVRIRNLGELVPVTRFHSDTVTLGEPLFGLAKGQSAVFYARLTGRGDEVVVGGGIILENSEV